MTLISIVLLCTLATGNAFLTPAALPQARIRLRSTIAQATIAQARSPLALRASSVRANEQGGIATVQDTIKSALLLSMSPLLALVLAAPPAMAEGRTGVLIFNQKCAACHQGGGNSVNKAKTLKSDALAKYGYDDLDKAIQIITKGKAPSMPAYGIKSKKLGLDPGEIEAVAQYVLDQAETGWAPVGGGKKE
mmetsp:Transcript_28476/g.41819  ORF Transcript_28476/g.41819 Transcript_28476/m.41819 type:complete len:192 (-) Transcript_28476:118-693(-)